MKKRNSLLKRIAAVALATMFLVVSVIPSYPSLTVKAASNDFPEEIHFPIQILDFRADNLLFEYDAWDSGLCLGKGYVTDTLSDPDENGKRYPVYRQDKVEEIAKNVQKTLEGQWRGGASQMPVLDNKTIVDDEGNTIKNPISLYTYIHSGYPQIDVLSTTYANVYKDGKAIVMDDLAKWQPTTGTINGARYVGIWPMLSAASNDLYSVEYDGLVMKPGTEVSQTFGVQPAGVSDEDFKQKIKAKSRYTISMERTKTSKVHVLVDGEEIKKQNGDIYISGAGDPTTTTKITIKSDADVGGTISKVFDMGNCTPNSANDANQNIFVRDENNYGQMTYGRLEGSASTLNAYGNVFIDGLGGAGNGRATYRVSSNQKVTDCTVNLYFATAGNPGRFTLSVNGTNYTATNPNESNTHWSTADVTPVEFKNVTLNAGINTIVVGGTGGNAPRLSGVQLSKPEGVEYMLCPATGTEEYNRYDGSYRDGMFSAQDSGWIRVEAESNTSPYWDTWTGGRGQFNRNTGDSYSNGAALRLYDGTSFGDYRFYSEKPGNRTIRFMFPDNWGRETFTLTVNGTSQTVSFDSNGKTASAAITLRQGMNDIRVAANVGAFDYFEISTDRLDYKVSNIFLDMDGGQYPLGDYDESKERYDADPDLGYYDGMTCMDYAYFVTSHFFKFKEGYNTVLNNYDELIFHKVDENGQISYEFNAAERYDKNGNKLELDLIYNKTNKTIRNAYGSDTGDTTKGDVVKPGGSMFVADDYTDRPYKDMDKDYQDHNFHYSIVSRSKFVYKEGKSQYFYFSGDDDVYVYVNGHLYMDMGGTHEQQDDSINLDDVAAEHPEYGIEDGKVVDLDLFYMERHTVASNFYSKMNFKLAMDKVNFDYEFKDKKGDYLIPYGFVVPLTYSFQTLRELNTNSNIRFTDNFGNVIGAKLLDENGHQKTVTNAAGEVTDDGHGGLTLGKNISVVESTLYATDENGYAKKDASGNYITVKEPKMMPVIGEDGLYVRDGSNQIQLAEKDVDAQRYILNVWLTDANGNEKLKQFVVGDPGDTGETTTSVVPADVSAAVEEFFTKLEMELEKTNKVAIDGLQYDTSVKPYKEYDPDTVTGEDGSVTDTGMRQMIFETHVDYKAKQVGAVELNDGYDNMTTTVHIMIGHMTLKVQQDNTEKRNLDDFGAFKFSRIKETINSGDFLYKNDPDNLRGTNESIEVAGFENDERILIFENDTEGEEDRVTGITFTQFMRGTYRLDLDFSVLTSYEMVVQVDDGDEVFATKWYNQNRDRYLDEQVPIMTLEPEYDAEAKTWKYPEVILKIKAKRGTPLLRDLT